MRKFADLYVEQENRVRTIYKVASLLKQAKDQRDAEQQPAKQREQGRPAGQGPKSGRRSTGKYHAQKLGPLTSAAGTTLLATLLGAITGGVANGWEGAGKGAAIGAGTGGGLSLAMNAGGKALGALVGPRTLAEQKKYDGSKGQTALNYLLPGAATFSRERTQATSEDEQQALERQRLLKGCFLQGAL